MFDIEQLFINAHPELCKNHPKIAKVMIAIGKRLWHEKFFQQFYQNNLGVERVDLINKGFEFIDFDFNFDNPLNIPKTGRVVIVANHPLGLLDGIGLIKKMREIRPDIKLVLNGNLCNLLAMHEYTIAADNFHGAMRKSELKAVYQHLKNEGAVVIFPAGVPSKLSLKGIVDRPWTAGFLHFALNNQAPVLPIFIEGRNSYLYYVLAWLAMPLTKVFVIVRELLLSRVVGELFSRYNNQRLTMRVGQLIESQSLESLNKSQQLALVREALYQLAP